MMQSICPLGWILVAIYPSVFVTVQVKVLSDTGSLIVSTFSYVAEARHCLYHGVGLTINCHWLSIPCPSDSGGRRTSSGTGEDGC